MADSFTGVVTNPGSGGAVIAADPFLDGSGQSREMPMSALTTGTIGGPYNVVNLGNPFPVLHVGALPSGTNVIGHVITDTGSTTAITGTVSVVQSGSWTVSVTGVATAANQATEIASLASIDSKIVAVNTGAVVVSSSALPSGGSTSAKQDTGNTSLGSIDGKTPALGQALVGASVPVVLPASQITTLTPPAAITGFATAVKQPALGTAGTASADVLTVQGIVSMTALKVDGSAVTQPVSGTVTANIGTVATLATSAKQDTGNTSIASIDTKTPALGQALAAASVPIVLTAAQLITLTPPAAITGFATSAKQDTGNTSLSSIDNHITACNTGAVVLAAGTAAFGKLSANAGVDIGAVELVAGQTLGTVTSVTTVGTITNAVNIGTKTTGGFTPYNLISAASTNGTNVKNSAGTLYLGSFMNNGSSAVYLKLYNKSSAPTVGTDTPVQTYMLPATGGYSCPLPAMGMAFGTGISFAITTGIAASDTGSVALNQVTVNLGYV